MESQPQDTPQATPETSLQRTTIRKTPSHILEQKRLAYAENPEEIKGRVRLYREKNANRVNTRHRQLATQRHEQERAARWAAYQQNQPDKTLPPGKQLRLWLDAQPRFTDTRIIQ